MESPNIEPLPTEIESEHVDHVIIHPQKGALAAVGDVARQLLRHDAASATLDDTAETFTLKEYRALQEGQIDQNVQDSIAAARIQFANELAAGNVIHVSLPRHGGKSWVANSIDPETV